MVVQKLLFTFMTNLTLGTQIALRYAELGKSVCGYDARVWNFRLFDTGYATKRSCPGLRLVRQNRHNLGENRFWRSPRTDKSKNSKRGRCSQIGFRQICVCEASAFQYGFTGSVKVVFGQCLKVVIQIHARP